MTEMTHMPHDDDDVPPKVYGSELQLLSYDPLIGILMIETDKGEVRLVVNRAAAAGLAFTLIEALGAEPSEAPEKMD